MLLILNFSALTFITNARTTMPFARLYSQMVCTQSEPADIPQFFFLGGVTATAPSRDLTDNKKKGERGLKQRRKQKEAAQGDPEPKKGNQEKEKNPSRVQR
jgi:hypothetical protein